MASWKDIKFNVQIKASMNNGLQLLLDVFPVTTVIGIVIIVTIIVIIR